MIIIRMAYIVGSLVSVTEKTGGEKTQVPAPMEVIRPSWTIRRRLFTGSFDFRSDGFEDFGFASLEEAAEWAKCLPIDKHHCAAEGYR